VFSGTVANIKPDPDGAFATFNIARVWKGNLAHRLVLPLHLDPEAYPLAEGSTYLIFADRVMPEDGRTIRVPTETEPTFYISSCSPSRVLSSPDERVEQLGTPHRPR
jgi:hypothetical protein